MKLFARITKLTNIGGHSNYVSSPERQKCTPALSLSADLSEVSERVDYISNSKRQENIVATSSPVDWKPYQEFERSNQKTNKKQLLS